MKKCIYLLGVIMLAACVDSHPQPTVVTPPVVPPPKVETSKADTERYWLEKGREKLKGRMRDPDSLVIIQEKIGYTENGQGTYQAKYRAKNGFGGYNVDVCEIELGFFGKL